MIDPSFFRNALIGLATINVALSAAIFIAALVVYLRRREAGFLILALVFAYRLVDTILSAFGFSIIAKLYERPLTNKYWLSYLPSLLLFLGFALLARARCKPAEPLSRTGAARGS